MKSSIPCRPDSSVSPSFRPAQYIQKRRFCCLFPSILQAFRLQQRCKRPCLRDNAGRTCRRAVCPRLDNGTASCPAGGNSFSLRKRVQASVRPETAQRHRSSNQGFRTQMSPPRVCRDNQREHPFPPICRSATRRCKPFRRLRDTAFRPRSERRAAIRLRNVLRSDSILFRGRAADCLHPFRRYMSLQFA